MPSIEKLRDSREKWHRHHENQTYTHEPFYCFKILFQYIVPTKRQSLGKSVITENGSCAWSAFGCGKHFKPAHAEYLRIEI